MNWRNTWAVLAWVVLAMSSAAVCHASQAFNSLEMGGGQQSNPLIAQERHELPVLEPMEVRLFMDVSLSGLTWFDPGTHPVAVDNHTPYSLTINDLPGGTDRIDIWWGDVGEGSHQTVQENLTSPLTLTHDYYASANHDSWTITVELHDENDDVLTKTVHNALPSVMYCWIPWNTIYGTQTADSDAENILDALMASGVRYVPITTCAWSQTEVSWLKNLLSLPKYNTDDFNFKTLLNVNCPEATFTSDGSGDVVQFTDPYSHHETYVYKDWLVTEEGEYVGQTQYWQAALCPNNTHAAGYGTYFDRLTDLVTCSVPDFVTVDIEAFQAPKIVQIGGSSNVLDECNTAYGEEGYAGYLAALQDCWVDYAKTIVSAINPAIKVINFRSWNNAYNEATTTSDLALGGASNFSMPNGDYPSPAFYNPPQIETDNVVDPELIDSVCDTIKAGNSDGIGYPWLYPTGDGTIYTSLDMDQFQQVCLALHDNGARGFAVYTATWDSATVLPYLRIAAEASSWVHVTNVMSGGVSEATISVDGITDLTGADVTLLGDNSSLFSHTEGETPTLTLNATSPYSVTVKVEINGQVYFGNVTLTPPPVITLDGNSGKEGLASNVTLFNNRGQFRTIKFDITDAIAGAFIQVFADGTSDVIASGTADQDGNVVLTTAPTGAGYHGLTPGGHVITVRQTPTDGTTSADASYTLIVNALLLNEGIFTTGNDSIYQGVVGKLSFYLNTPIQDKSQASVSIFKWNGSDWGSEPVVTVNNTDDSTNHVTLGTSVYGDKVDCDLLTYETGGGEYSWGTSLGWYRATITIGGVSQSWVFARLPADFTFDGHVNFSDYLVLEQAFNRFGTYLPGDGNLDGAVNFIDYLMLEQKFNTAAGDPPTVVAG